MIHSVAGDATQPKGEGNKILVHVCNDLGKWGKGFVLAVSRRWKEPERQYKLWADGKTDQKFKLGEVQFVQVQEDLWVANLIGQHGVKTQGSRSSVPPIRYEAIRQGLATVAEFALAHEASVHMPRIGAGLAGGDWQKISEIIEETLVQKKVQVTVYHLP
ncbi:macro domain-containing protein [Deinococcus cellulosilyticus]|uniref:Appr-1-p processing protein n=1 Tax=Deinococcus cellulosilyticus (strain DSM 18568 / NBRC 106333 / KACC 11606 / 5516J-15) TaxID=1223518 RepID=A0A511MYD2_DEIC1|nr:macro domain-containing protein [Deinococcus cellulosilyticus]GEM45288.1 Appr-1-p processing protein [Deinococcus cellulosilyticus NBRC 106333 = KACC 11606]